MKLTSVRAVIIEAVQGGFRAAEREAALDGIDGFADAWPDVDSIPGWFGEVEAAVFWAVVHRLRPATVVEIGSYQGRSTILLGLALQHAGVPSPRLVAIDPHTGDRQQLERLDVPSVRSLDMFRMHTEAAGVDGLIDLRVQTSAAVAPDWTDPIDLLFVDGWHSYDAVRDDGRNFASHLARGGLVCFDDYAKYPDVRAAVDDVCREIGLTVYGTVVEQAWAGWSTTPPPVLARVLRIDAMRQRLGRFVRH